ncbi:HAD family hydrolase [Endothiovibrio diazotrophicus]
MREPFYLVDFDGVVCDSRAECMVTGYAAYRELKGEPFEPAFTVDDVPADAAEAFIRFRYLARTAREFMVIWDLIEAGSAIDPDLPLDRQWEIDAARIMRYHELFYATRYRWMERDERSWVAIHALFPGMKEWLVARLAEGRAHLVSSKDSRSILTILRNNGVELPDDLVSGNEGGDKPGHFRRLIEEHPGRELYFIDDNLENLEMAAAQGIAGCLCTWGYTWEGGIEAAKRQGFPTLGLDGLAQLA